MIAVDVTQKRPDKAVELAATDAVNGRTQDTVAEVLRLTGGDGPDLVIETPGTKNTTR